MKTCGKCGAVKPLSDYHKRAASVDGLAYKCKPCVNADTAAWREKNPGAHQEWYARNRDKRSADFVRWRELNAERRKEYMAEWSKANPEKINAKCARRRAAKMQAVPRWADLSAVEAIYAKAAQLRDETGERYEVDHVVPLQGPTVCGLHWECNLQILTEFENISKHNRRWPDQP